MEMPKLQLYYIAFLDLLGFSGMVEADCNGPSNGVTFLPKLFSLHERIVSMANIIPGATITQFSDSIVLSVPYDVSQFTAFVELIANYQYYLLENGLLCRGGISFGKHFQDGTFIFSEGLIKAYRIETSQARYPRVVVDTDIIDLLNGHEVFDSDNLLSDADGAKFLHYMRFKNLDKDKEIVTKLTQGHERQPVSIKEKLRWLQEYFSFCYPKSAIFDCARFKFTR